MLVRVAADTTLAPQPTQRRDALFAMQAAAQKKWAECRTFEAEAPPAGASNRVSNAA